MTTTAPPSAQPPAELPPVPDRSGASDIAGALARGETEFMGLRLRIRPDTLVPRPETELLAGAALQVLQDMQPWHAPWVIDMCCGTGNLACAIAHRLPAARLWASDLTDACVQAARANVRALALGARVQVHQGDLFAGLQGLRLEGMIDAVVCNPPYISAARLAGERAGLLDHEPRAAFDGGPYGLSIHQRVIQDAGAFLRPGGCLLFEIGLGQERQVERLFARHGGYARVEPVANAAGQIRVVRAWRDGPGGAPANKASARHGT